MDNRFRTLDLRTTLKSQIPCIWATLTIRQPSCTTRTRAISRIPSTNRCTPDPRNRCWPAMATVPTRRRVCCNKTSRATKIYCDRSSVDRSAVDQSHAMSSLLAIKQTEPPTHTKLITNLVSILITRSSAHVERICVHFANLWLRLCQYLGAAYI